MLYLGIPWGVGDEPRRARVPYPVSSKWANELSSLSSILFNLMPYIFSIAGLILLFMIISSGYSMLTSAGNPESVAKAKSRLTASFAGFIIVLAAFWIYQLVEEFLGGPGVFSR